MNILPQSSKGLIVLWYTEMDTANAGTPHSWQWNTWIPFFCTVNIQSFCEHCYCLWSGPNTTGKKNAFLFQARDTGEFLSSLPKIKLPVQEANAEKAGNWNIKAKNSDRKARWFFHQFQHDTLTKDEKIQIKTRIWKSWGFTLRALVFAN